MIQFGPLYYKQVIASFSLVKLRYISVECTGSFANLSSVERLRLVRKVSWSSLTVSMLRAPSNRRRPFSYHTKMADFENSRVLSALS